MNEFLAELYNTRETIGASKGDDVEKLAEAQALDQFLQGEGVDIDRLDGDTILKVAHQLFGDESALLKAAAEEGESEEGEHEEHETPEEEEVEEEAKKKVAEADYLGRLMAHAFVQEQSELAKEAGIKETAGKAWAGLKAHAGKASDKGSKAWASTKAHAGKAYAGTKDAYKAKNIREAVSELRSMPKGAPKKEAIRKLLKGMGQTGAAYGIPAAGVAYGATKAFGGKSKEKRSSAIDALAEQRAVEIYQLLQNENSEEKLASAIDDRAIELLEEQGLI
jgi:hypothetical protein